MGSKKLAPSSKGQTRALKRHLLPPTQPPLPTTSLNGAPKQIDVGANGHHVSATCYSESVLPVTGVMGTASLPAPPRRSFLTTFRKLLLLRKLLFVTTLVVAGVCLMSQVYMHESITEILRHTQRNQRVDLAGSEQSQSQSATSSVLGTNKPARPFHLIGQLPPLIQRRPEEQAVGPNFRAVGGNQDSLEPTGVTHLRPPKVALVCPDLAPSGETVYLLTIAEGLIKLGYTIEVVSAEGGSAQGAWQELGGAVLILNNATGKEPAINWLRYDAVIANSLGAKNIIARLVPEPFSHVPLVWVLHSPALARRLKGYREKAMEGLLDRWRSILGRAHLLVVPSPELQVAHSLLDLQTFRVVSGTPNWVLEADRFSLTHNRDELRKAAGLEPEDFALVVASAREGRRGVWREHALAMQALMSATSKMTSAYSMLTSAVWAEVLGESGRRAGGMARPVSVGVFVTGREWLGGNYSAVLEALAAHLGLPAGTVRLVDGEDLGALWLADAVVCSGPPAGGGVPRALVAAMALGRRVAVARQPWTEGTEIKQGINGLLYLPENRKSLEKALQKLLRQDASSAAALSEAARLTAGRLGAAEVAAAYGTLLEEIIDFGGDVAPPHWPAGRPRNSPTQSRPSSSKERMSASSGGQKLDLGFNDSKSESQRLSVGDRELETARQSPWASWKGFRRSWNSARSAEQNVHLVERWRWDGTASVDRQNPKLGDLARAYGETLGSGTGSIDEWRPGVSSAGRPRLGAQSDSVLRNASGADIFDRVGTTRGLPGVNQSETASSAAISIGVPRAGDIYPTNSSTNNLRPGDVSNSSSSALSGVLHRSPSTARPGDSNRDRVPTDGTRPELPESETAGGRYLPDGTSGPDNARPDGTTRGGGRAGEGGPRGRGGEASAVEEEERRWVEGTRAAACAHPNCTAGSLLMAEMDPFEEVKTEEDAAEERRAVQEEIEQEELAERDEQLYPSWDDMGRQRRRAERRASETEREDGEAVRLGQPLCIYEGYEGEGAWPFVHANTPLYRGVSWEPKSRRPIPDDIVASTRLPLLRDAHYRDGLCELGAMLAVAYRIDRIHKHPWIGFQPWQAAAQKVSLSEEAERALWLEIERGQYGDALFFWVPSKDLPGAVFLPDKTRAESKPSFGRQKRFSAGSQLQAEALASGREKGVEDFWATCDNLNAGHCREAFVEGMRGAYGLPASWQKLPPMPRDGDTWAGMNSWVLPSSSFVEFIMFARLFVDALDAKYSRGCEDRAECCPMARSRTEARHCYCRILDGLINVWAYHSGRRFLHIDRSTGMVVEHHPVASRRGDTRMWRKWFRRNVLKGIDEERAEESEEEPGGRKSLWSRTGEVWWKGSAEREKRAREKRHQEKVAELEKKLAQKRANYKQKPLGKYKGLKREKNDTSAIHTPVNTSIALNSSNSSVLGSANLPLRHGGVLGNDTTGR